MALRTVCAVLAALTMLAVGCAKRPAMSQAAAPPPTGAAVTTPPAAPPPAVPPVAQAPVAPPPAPAPPAPPPVAAPPPPARPGTAEFRVVPELRDVFFDFDKYVIRPDAAKTLDAGIEWLKSNPTALILIEGHCDERGTNAYNLALGERRARAAQEYLVNKGVAATRITVISYGEERPACASRTEACWAQNRRAHFLARQP